MEASLHFQIVPRGMRVLCMPPYGDSHPELLSRWQKLNLELSNNYMKLLIDYFSPIEAELMRKVEALNTDIRARFKNVTFARKLENLYAQVAAYSDRLQQTKYRRLQRDYRDFSTGQVFVWSKNISTTSQATSDNRYVEKCNSSFNNNNKVLHNDTPNIHGAADSNNVTDSGIPIVPLSDMLPSNITSSAATPPPNQQALIEQKEINGLGARPKALGKGSASFLPYPVKLREPFRDRSHSRGRRKRKFSGGFKTNE